MDKPIELEARARQLRGAIIRMAHAAKEGHLNGALSCVEILLVLFRRILGSKQGLPKDPDRDRLIFSKGHACAALYAAMADAGHVSWEDLAAYGKPGSAFPSHPCAHALPLLDCSSGSLGHGLGVGTGIAYGQQLRSSGGRTFVVLSDGECNEGSTWEAAMFATASRLENLVVIVDHNGTQSIGRADALSGGASLLEKFASFGWDARGVDGHDCGQLTETLGAVPLSMGRPSAIIAKTRAGKGAAFMEDQILWHYRTPSAQDVERALEELGVTGREMEERANLVGAPALVAGPPCGGPT